MKILAINLHPLKSSAIRPVEAAQVQLRGLVDDRSWMVVDGDGAAVTAREVHALFRITSDTARTDPQVTSALRLRAPGLPPLEVDEPVDGDRVEVQLFSQRLGALPAAAEAHEWVGRAIGREDVRLVWCPDPSARRLDPAHARAGDHTAFADGYPVTVATTGSLRQLNEWMVSDAVERGDEAPDPLPMQRFRPNLVLDCDEPFAEDRWAGLTIGGVRMRNAKPNERCVMTTIDLSSLDTGKEPIRTLARYRRSGSKTLFATNLIPDSTGEIRVGDEVLAH